MRSLYRLLATVIALSALILPSAGPAQAKGRGDVTLPFSEVGEFTNADYKISVPEDWNGTLLVYAHGYAFDIDAYQPAAAPGGEAFEEALLGMGYAVAGSSFRNGGWAVKEGIQNTLALTNRFNGLIGKPDRTIIWGFSMGSLVALDLIEQHAATYDGAIAACAVGAGAPTAWDTGLAFALAYDVAFGWPASWGNVADVRDDIDFATEVAPVLAWHLDTSNPDYAADLARFEFMRRVAGLPADEFYPSPGKLGWLFLDMLFSTQYRGELEARAGGPVAQNGNQVYSLSPFDIGALEVLGLPQQDSLALLAAMNARTDITASKAARNYITKYATFTGNLKRPVITAHTSTDGLVVPWNEVVYGQTVAAAGKSDYLLQTYVTATGHCNFSPFQLISLVAAMDGWIASGVRPDPASAFPAPLGFDNGFSPAAPPFLPVSSASVAGTATRLAPAMPLPIFDLYLPAIER